MATKSAFSILGLSHKFCLAAEAAGITPAHLNAMAEDKTGLLAGLLAVHEGRAAIRMIEEPASVASAPVIVTFGLVLPVEKQAELLGGFQRLDEDQLPNPRASGTVAWNPSMLELFLVADQKDGGVITGFKVRDAIRDSGKELYGIADLEQMREKGLLPDAPVGTHLFAWGDILRVGGCLCVRYLIRDVGGWHWHYNCLGVDWASADPAAVSASRT